MAHTKKYRNPEIAEWQALAKRFRSRARRLAMKCDEYWASGARAEAKEAEAEANRLIALEVRADG